MKHFTIRRGDRPPAFPEPTGPIEDTAGVTSVAVLGEDWPGMRPHMEVEVGAHVERGQTLFTDRKHREVCFVSPVSGVVDRLTYGPRRTLDALIIRVEPGTIRDSMPPERGSQHAPRTKLLSAGFWPAFRTRPFGAIPAPDAIPDAIVINAVRATPQAPDPALVLQGYGDEFRLGCEALTQLTDGPVHVCQTPGAALGPELQRVRHSSFSGTTAAGLVGTQIDLLCRGEDVWSVGYQDVAAIGAYLATGRYLAEKVVSITGPMASPPRLLRLPVGARLADVIDVSLARATSGVSGSGREATFLGRFVYEITLLPPAPPARHWRIPSRRPGHSAAVPCRALEQTIAVDVLPIPLLRALSIGDTEAAERLGCLALIEEDLASATRRCTSGVDYGACLRSVLSDLMAEAA